LKANDLDDRSGEKSSKIAPKIHAKLTKSTGARTEQAEGCKIHEVGDTYEIERKRRF